MKQSTAIVALGISLAGLSVSMAGRAQDAPGSGPSSATVSDEGKQVYEQICQACHLADAKGSNGGGAVVPALAGNAKLADAKYMLGVVIKGRGGMPWFNEMLTPGQIAAVINYVRHHFNSYPDTVSLPEVEAAIAAKSASETSQ